MLRADGDPGLRAFDPVIRFLHWVTLFLVITIFVFAFSIDFASSKEEAVALIQLHRSFGVTVWVVTLGRLGANSRASPTGPLTCRSRCGSRRNGANTRSTSSC
jgi:cytochrome b561